MRPSLAVSRATKLLAGTVPQHSSYLLLHHPRRPSTYPPKLDAAFSPLLAAVQARAAVGGWGMGVNVAYLGDGSEEPSEGADAPDEPQTSANATLFRFSSGRDGLGRWRGFRLPRPLRLDDRGELAIDNLGGSTSNSLEDALDLEEAEEDTTPHLLVCTHAQRDCRCGDTGGAVAAELRRRAGQGVTIGELGHVGGHKYAANVLLFPIGDWFGDIQPQHGPLLLKYALDVSQGATATPPEELVPHWRGGRGLSKDAQVQMATEWSRLYDQK